MASPQIENGHTDIANEILDAFARIRIPGEARQLLDVILRKTYGWHKKQDIISLSQFSRLTGMPKSHVCVNLEKLRLMNLITEKGKAFTEKDNEIGKVYEFNKDFDTWRPLPKKVTLPKKVINRTQKGKAALPLKGTTKENYYKRKENKLLSYSDPLFLKFWEEYPKNGGGKKPAYQAWKRISPDNGLVETIMKSLDLHKRVIWKDREPDKIPHATTWLNQARWEAEIPKPPGEMTPEEKAIAFKQKYGIDL